MKKAYLLTLALLLPVHAGAVEQDSVYIWGKWASGLKPAAGPIAKVTPPPAQTPDVNFRANESSALLREATIAFRPAPPVTPSAPQLPSVVIAPSGTITTPTSRL